MIARFFTVLIALLVAASASAQVGSLISIPVAGTKEPHEVELGYFVTGTERSIDKGYSHSAYGVFGIARGLEVAASTDFLGGSTWGFKVKLLEPKKSRITVGGGLQGIGAGLSNPFLVGMIDQGALRLHVGWSRDDRDRLLLGADYTLNEKVSLAADFTTGHGGSAWGGVYVAVPQFDWLQACVYIQFPNDRSEGIHHSLGLIATFKF